MPYLAIQSILPASSPILKYGSLFAHQIIILKIVANITPRQKPFCLSFMLVILYLTEELPSVYAIYSTLSI